MVRDGGVREMDRLGNNAADEADFGRQRVEFPAIDARRNLSGVCGRWCPVVLALYRFFILLFQGPWFFMRREMLLHLTPWSGLLVLFQET